MSAGGSDKTGSRRRGPKLDRGEAKPRARTEAAPPLGRLAPERLADFLELALQPDELLRICRKLGLSSPGYRIEKLSAPDHASLLAEEYAHESRSQPAIEDAVAASLKTPALRMLWLTAPASRELAQLVSGDPITSAARLVWRFIGDGDPGVRAAAERALDAGLELLEKFEDLAELGPTPPPAPHAGEEPPAPAADEDLTKRLARAERDREAARAQLQQARVEVAERDRRINGLKQELASLRMDNATQGAELSRLHASRSADERRDAHDQRKLAAERKHLEEKVTDLEERLASERRRAGELAQALAAEQKKPQAPLNQPPDAAPDAEGAGLADFVVPRFTQEFYDSLEKWDRRIVKSAFEKVLLLARDRRHPSLRALPIEGADNLFRIRIATDVRLIYRRGEGHDVEILSLIDREDLERYIRQAKTRRDG